MTNVLKRQRLLVVAICSPDIIVLPKGERDDRRLKREADLDNHLPEEQEKPNNAAHGADAFEGAEDTSTNNEADPQFARALMYLKQGGSRQNMVKPPAALR